MLAVVSPAAPGPLELERRELAGVGPAALALGEPRERANTLVRQADFQTGKRILAIPPEADQLWQDAWAEFKAGV